MADGHQASACKIGGMIGPLGPALIGLLVWTSFAWGQRPSDADAAALIERSRQKALDYARSLPDFVCTEVIRRFSQNAPDHPRNGVRGPWVPLPFRWVPTDKLTVKLSYSQLKEEHKLISINDRPTDLKYEGLTGGTGAGEFGGTLQNIFQTAAQTAFRWESWKTVRRHRRAVYAYQVDVTHSHYMVVTGAPGATRQAIVGFHGNLEIDRETGEVLHFTYLAEIPKELNLDQADTTVDYDLADVGGRDYLLPVHSQTEMRSPRLSVRNDVDFREYRKFSADSVIDYTVAK